MIPTSRNERLQSGFHHWISIQRNNLKELLHALTVANGGDVELFRHLADKNIQHLIDHQQIKSGCDIYSSVWGTSLENSLFWIGGFKPSIYIRLASSITGMEPEMLVGLKKLKVADGETSACGVDTEKYSSTQLKLMKDLNANTVSREAQISSRMTNFQEGGCIEPRIVIASNNSNHELELALAAHGVELSSIVVDADELRVTVLKELMHILTPIQGIRLLIASYRLHLSIHECGRK
ncbi:protein DOG1-like 3 [Rutidosis leptorrhynchoides]|uniref:protein DOG1-like 3 n=1 Tax=Rutidosis leptorrhynchoides TaxID=125765 RepID=UPI003A98EB76